jgi:hypothetical protein
MCKINTKTLRKKRKWKGIEMKNFEEIEKQIEQDKKMTDEELRTAIGSIKVTILQLAVNGLQTTETLQLMADGICKLTDSLDKLCTNQMQITKCIKLLIDNLYNKNQGE